MFSHSPLTRVLAFSQLFLYCMVFSCHEGGAVEGKEKPSRIWSDLFDAWDVEPFCGTESSPLPPAFFQQGPRMESGTASALVIAKDNTAYGTTGTAVFRITPQGRVELLAGTPGMAGYRDGRADRALFNGISVMAVSSQGTIFVLDRANRCIRTIAPQEKGPWQVTTLVGDPQRKERKDGKANEASFENPCGLTVFEDGSIFIMDNDFLRLFKGGKLTTVNTQGGNGFADGPLEKARFRIAFTSNCLTSDGQNLLYIADMWNNVLRKIDWTKQEILTVSGGPIRSDPKSRALREGRDPFQDGQGMEALFHPGGGITTVWCERRSGNVYITVADDAYPHVYTPDGWVRSLRTDVPVAVDEEGRVFTCGHGGIWRLHRLRPGEAPFNAEAPPLNDPLVFALVPFNPQTIPADVVRKVISHPEKSPTIDGKLDDECWKGVPAYKLSTLQGEAAPKETATEMHLAADQSHLYVTVRCIEPKMGLMKKPNRPHDDALFYTEDYVEIFLIPGLDPRGEVFQLMINSEGITWDGKNKNPNNWNPHMDVKTSREDGAWNVELAIPLSEIPGGAHQALWRMNVGRSRPKRGNEGPSEWSWSELNSSSSHTYSRFNVVALEALEGKLP